MVLCPRCGNEVPEGSQFCNACGVALTEASPDAAHEERKVVSVLFCDLVGFTAASDAADPEDVRARVRPYHALLRSEIERYGGTVEKFIGDAVMAVFGAPVAHEDDPERAVRAGLRILEAIAELNEAEPDARAPGAGRDQHRRGGGRTGSAPGAGRGHRHRRCRQHGLPPAGGGSRGRDRLLGADLPGDAAGLQLRRTRACRGEGQGRSRLRSGARSRPAPASEAT